MQKEIKIYYKILLIILLVFITIITVFFLTYNQIRVGSINYESICSQMDGNDERKIKYNTSKGFEKLKYLINIFYLFKESIGSKSERIKFQGRFVIYTSNSEYISGTKNEQENIKVIMHDLEKNRFYDVKIGSDYTFFEYIPPGNYLITMWSEKFGVGGITINLRENFAKDLSIRLVSKKEEITRFQENCQDIEDRGSYSIKQDTKCSFEDEDFTCSIEGSIETPEEIYKNISVIVLPELKSCENGAEVLKSNRAMIWGDILNERGRFFLKNIWCKEVEVYIFDRIKMNFCKRIYINFFKKYELVKVYESYTLPN